MSHRLQLKSADLEIAAIKAQIKIAATRAQIKTTKSQLLRRSHVGAALRPLSGLITCRTSTI